MIVAVAYVDTPKSYPNAEVAKRYGPLWCHLLPNPQAALMWRAGDREALASFHRFAKRLGLRPEWFQGKGVPHYDLVPSRRAAALTAGAVELDGKTWARCHAGQHMYWAPGSEGAGTCRHCGASKPL